MSRKAQAVLCLGLGYICRDAFILGINLGLARWQHRVLRADELA